MRRALAATCLLAACGGADDGGTANEVPILAPGGSAETTGIAPAPGVYPFQGVWAGEGAACEDAGLGLEGGPLVITTRSVDYVDAACAIDAVEVVEPSSDYDVFLDCENGGESASGLQRFVLSGDTLTITNEGQDRRYERCEADAANE